ncbi:MAG: hypothetical protein HYV25_00930, partial [Candidatus Harrisonbacteria bacterium]|nr:hypothetical protein [Candidatus Harrisonbacteria bacterium]
MKITPKTGIWIAIVAVLGVLLSWFVIVGPKSVPREFGEARREGTRLTEEI